MHQRLTAQGIPPRKASRQGWAQSRVLEMVRDAISHGDAADQRTPPGEVRRPHGLRGRQARHPGQGQGRTRRPQRAWMPVRVPARIDAEPGERAPAPLVRTRERAPRHNTPHR
jgi:hypothetical protein